HCLPACASRHWVRPPDDRVDDPQHRFRRRLRARGQSRVLRSLRVGGLRVRGQRRPLRDDALNVRVKTATLACVLIALSIADLKVRTTTADVGWLVNGGTDNIRYSPLTQINRRNVSRLQVAWIYDSHDAFKGSEM